MAVFVTLYFSASSSSFAFSFGYFSLPMKTPSKFLVENLSVILQVNV